MLFGLILSVLLIGVSLSVDAFAVSVCDGMIYKNMKTRQTVSIPLTFGFFQAAMPITGFYVGKAFLRLIDTFDHWIAFALLLVIGGKMIADGIKQLHKKDKDEPVKIKNYSLAEVLLQGVATSIDALAVGFSLNAILEGSVSDVTLWAWLSVFLIGCTTFLISLTGVMLGRKAGKMFSSKANAAQIAGGVVLVLIGLKIVLGAYFNLPF